MKLYIDLRKAHNFKTKVTEISRDARDMSLCL